jgi:hypothetical protein
VKVVETNGPKKRKLNVITDYNVGFGKGKDIFDNTIPREVHLVAVEAKTSIGKQRPVAMCRRSRISIQDSSGCWKGQ